MSRRIDRGICVEVVMADTAYDADHLRETVAAKGAIAVIQKTRQGIATDEIDG
jgi:hypothetical protein